MGLDEIFIERVRERKTARESVSSIWNTEMHNEYMERVRGYGIVVANLATGAGIGYDVPVTTRLPRTAGRGLGRIVQIGGWSLEIDRSWRSNNGQPGYWDEGTLLMRDGTFRDFAQYLGSTPDITAPEARIVNTAPVSSTSDLLTNLADFVAKNDLLTV